MGMSKGDRSKMIRSMVERLAAKMKQNPKDKDGWIRLERAYRVLGETALANEAAVHAVTLP
jgi:cytochrome c-type biogenesis protein CcmH